MLKILTTLTILLSTSCNLFSPSQELPSTREDLPSLSSDQTETSEESTQPCTNLRRALNPDPTPASSESELDRHFRLAFEYETGGDFDQAIFHYRKAAELAKCDCDRLHAEAGEKAAVEARDLLEREGMASKPTQYFWGRLQDLTQTLPCIEVRQ